MQILSRQSEGLRCCQGLVPSSLHTRYGGDAAMEIDDPAPESALIGLSKLGSMGIEQLQDYVLSLEAEISRVHDVMERKIAARAAAEFVFKPKAF